MNSDKCHLILSSNDENKKIELNGEVINNTQEVINFSVFILITLKVWKKKLGKKFHVLAQIIKYMSTNQAHTNINEKFHNVAIQLLSTHLDVS